MSKKETIVRESENFTPLVMGGLVSGSNGIKSGRSGKIMPSDICVYDKGVEIRHYQLLQYLAQEGFYSFKVNGDKHSVYRVIDGVANRCETSDVIKFILETVMHKKTPRGEYKCVYDFHREVFVRNPSRYFGESKIQLLPPLDAAMLRDTKECAYFPFINGVVKVSKDSIKVYQYKDVLKGDKIVLGSKIIKRGVKVLSKDDAFKGNFALFASRAVGDDGFSALCRSMGYMLHTYKDASRAKMVFFSDANKSDGIARGRSGKSLCANLALSQLRKVSVIDGKQFSANDRFMLDGFDMESDIISFQDMRKAFDKETLYNMITGDLQVSKKYLSTRVIPFEYSPKIIADSNYGISLIGSSDVGRINVIGFDNYYSDVHQPIHEFGKVFFNEWSEDEWNKFYTFMFFCVQMYLNEGLSNYRLDEMMSNNLYTLYPMELVEMIKLNIDFLKEEHTIEEWWNVITFWNGDELLIPRKDRLATVNNIMNKLGYSKRIKKKSIRQGDSTTSVYLHWFED